MAERPQPERGLPSIRQARELRQRRPAAASSRFWLWSGLALAIILIFYWKKSQTENEAYRVRILSKQRAVAAEMGPLFFPFRDTVERFTKAIADDPWQEQLPAVGTNELNTPDLLLQRAGIYLRLAQPDARSPETLRAAAVNSLKDAFLTCLLHTSAPDPHSGPECRTAKQCTPGQICNEVGHCSTLTQPYNLRVAYRGTRVLSENWVRDVETATDELRLRLFETDLGNSMESDIPLAIDLLKRAHYFLVVVDEIPSGLVPRGEETIEQTVQAEVHWTRVGLLDLHSGVSIFQTRLRVDVPLSAAPTSAIDIQRRQVLNCALAQEIQQIWHENR